jgi:hypothetical protein
MADESVLDAVNFALENNGASPSEELEVDSVIEDDSDADTSNPETEGDTGSVEGDEGADSEPGEGEDGTDTGETPDVKGAAPARERNADGTFKTAEQKAADKATSEAAAGKKVADPINDPVPRDLKPATQERIRTLVATAKEVTADRDRVKQDFDYMVQGVQATGASPEQYGETLSWLAMFNSNDPTQQEKALELVESVADRLSTLLGKERNVGDPLSAHADLKDAVARGQVTAKYASEIARTRNSQQFRGQLTAHSQQQTQQAQAQAHELGTARNDLTTLENTLQATDPQYATKKSILVAALKPVFASIPPSQWKSKFEEAYRNLKVPGGAKPAVRAAVPANQPMRAGKQPAGGQARQAGSMLEAVSGALAGMKG